MWCRSRAPSACPRVWEGCQGGCLLGLQQCPPSCWAQARQRLVWTSPRPRGFSHHPLPAFAWEPGELRAVSGSRGASSLTGRCVPCLSPCRWMQACAPGTAPGIGSWPPGHAARAPVLCLLLRGQCRPCVRLVIRSPSLPTCLPSAPSSPARQSLCPALRAPKISWHLRPSLSKTREGRRGPGRLGRVVRLGGKGERSLVGRLRPSRCGPSPKQVCLSPCPHPSPGHTHPERP